MMIHQLAESLDKSERNHERSRQDEFPPNIDYSLTLRKTDDFAVSHDLRFLPWRDRHVADPLPGFAYTARAFKT
jgi:hypothetical protein